MRMSKIQVKMVSIMIIFTLALSPMTVSATESDNSMGITAPESIGAGETSEGIFETEETFDTEEVIVNEETGNEQDSTANDTMVGQASILNADVQISATISELFPDPNFAIAIASKLNLTVDDYVDNSDLEWIKSLSANRYGIKSIQGIEYLTNLVSLSLRENQISDLSPLENLIHLNYIVLGSNQVIDVSPLENLTNLTYLNLASNQITDISNLELLTNLETLYLSDNQIADIDILKNFTNLSLFGIGYNQVSDVSALANLSNLDYLDLSFNVISDISPLGNLVSLSTLFLDGNVISDPGSLGTLTNLSYLSLAFNQISDLKGLEGLINLQSIDLYQNQISDISILENLNLYYASVEGQAITLPPAVITGTSLMIQNPIVGLSDTIIIDGITPSGSYDTGADEITFIDLSESGEASFHFNQTTEGDAYIAFEGIVTQPYAMKVEVTSINLNKSELSFSGKGENETLIAAILPENATCKTITWTTGNEKVATVDSNGNVTAVGNGTTEIAAKSDDSDLMAVCKVTVAISTPVEEFVTRLYKIILERDPDSPGFNNWVNALNSGKSTGASVIQAFYNSSEYKSKHTSNADFIESVYKAILNRESDASGKAFWMQCLTDGVSRDYILNGLVNSSEFTNLFQKYGIPKGSITLTQYRDQDINITRFVQRLYNSCLGRASDIEGLNHWTKGLVTGVHNAASVVQGFYASDEYKKKGASNEAYIESLYKSLLNRGSDTAGKVSWLGYLNKGYSRKFILSSFVGSVEFTNICASYGLTRGSIVTNASDRP